jgi:hypothetical protein
MKTVLTITAILESGTGLVLIAVPSLLTQILFDVILETPAALAVVRIAGAALVSLGLACWLARNQIQSIAAKGLVIAMFLYNTVIAFVLAYSAISSGLSGFGLWPAVLIHLSFGIWCVMSLLNKSVQKK